MAIKEWKVSAEVDMDASRYDSVIVKANTERKARIKGEEILKKYHFYITNVKVEQINEYHNETTVQDNRMG